eukprot:TRINITY_DN1734_c0_g1_i2.p1 TRINITY_DN1734_c0_g1~~TRINITY_DN1734_c0_g1_i2.p1  ORF type:complete len:375 (+),score=58.50 TRINITY_DN1734_c0_g1_i2:168-1292(+)
MDERFTKKGILSLLEREFQDNSCQQLAKLIRKLPSSDTNFLFDAIKQTQSLKPTSNEIKEDDWKRAISLFGLEVTKSILKLVMQVLIRELGQLSVHVRHWKASIKAPVSHFVQNMRWDWISERPANLGWKPTSWIAYLAHIHRLDVNDKLNRLAQCEETFSAQLGHLHTWSTYMESIPSFRQEVRQFIQLAQKLYEFVSGVEHTDNSQDPSKLLITLSDTLVALPSFEAWFSNQSEPLHKPSHIRRHCLLYATGAVGLSVLSGKIYSNRSSEGFGLTCLMPWKWEWPSRACTSVSSSLSSVTFPIKSKFNSLRVHPGEITATETSVHQDQETLRTMLQDYGAAHAKQIAKVEQKTTQEFMNELQKSNKKQHKSL